MAKIKKGHQVVHDGVTGIVIAVSPKRPLKGGTWRDNFEGIEYGCYRVGSLVKFKRKHQLSSVGTHADKSEGHVMWIPTRELKLKEVR